MGETGLLEYALSDIFFFFFFTIHTTLNANTVLSPYVTAQSVVTLILSDTSRTLAAFISWALLVPVSAGLNELELVEHLQQHW